MTHDPKQTFSILIEQTIRIPLGPDLRHNEIAEQRGKIVRLIDRPERLQVRLRLLLRPALTHVPSEFPLNLASEFIGLPAKPGA